MACLSVNFRWMSWDIEDKESAAVITMNSNPVGVMSDGFFSDLNSAFDTLKQKHPSKPVVLSSGGKMFSPGFDLEGCVKLFKRGNKREIDLWLGGFLESMLAVFRHPAPVAAAIEGHAIAGGCILALCCDLRIAEKEGKALVGLNETSIGFPMPESLAVLVNGILGEKAGKQTVKEGKLHSVEQALEIGIISRLVPQGTVVSSAVKELEKINTEDFIQMKKARNTEISHGVEKAFADKDSKTLAGKLSSAQTVGKLEGLLEVLKREKK